MRYSAQRYGTWEWLDLELPLDTEGPEWVLSSYGIMDGVVSPDLGLLKAEDGRPVLEEWGTLIHAEVGEGETSRRWTGIVTRSELRGKEWTVTVFEFPGYLQGTPTETLIRGVDADPANLFRQVWQDVQAMPNSWMNVNVHGSTPVRIGTDSDDKAAIARSYMDGRKQTLDSLSETKTEKTAELQDATATLADEVALARAQVTSAQNSVNLLIQSGATPAQIAAARAVVATRQATLTSVQATYTSETDARNQALALAKADKDSAQAAYDEARTAYDAAREKAREDGGAYEIRPEDVPDALESIKSLCDTAGIEWTTGTKYSDDIPNLSVTVHYPEAGTRRDDLVFEQGVNIISELHLVRDGEEYANAAVGVGAGEGEESIRASIASTSNRMRRVAVVEDRSLKTKNDLMARMRADLAEKTGEPYVAEIEVVDHELAPIFSWNVGDRIMVSGEVPHYGYYSKLHRIISWQLVNDNKALLRLKLSTTDT